MTLTTVTEVERLHVRTYFLGQDAGAGYIGVRQNNGKLIAAVARYQIAGTGDIEQAIGNGHKSTVTELKAVFLVHFAEGININDHDGHRQALAEGEEQLLLQETDQKLQII